MIGAPPAESRERVPAWARLALLIPLLGMATVALWPPLEILDGNFEPVGTTRRFVFAESPVGQGFHRLRLWRLCIEEGVFVVGAAFVLRAARGGREAGG